MTLLVYSYLNHSALQNLINLQTEMVGRLVVRQAGRAIDRQSATNVGRLEGRQACTQESHRGVVGRQACRTIGRLIDR